MNMALYPDDKALILHAARISQAMQNVRIKCPQPVYANRVNPLQGTNAFTKRLSLITKRMIHTNAVDPNRPAVVLKDAKGNIIKVSLGATR